MKARDAKKYLYDTIKDEFASDEDVYVYNHANSSAQGLVSVEVMGVVFDNTEYRSMGNGGNSYQMQGFRIALSITAKGYDEDHGAFEDICEEIYVTIDGLVKADYSFGGLLDPQYAMCSPEQIVTLDEGGLKGCVWQSFVTVPSLD